MILLSDEYVLDSGKNDFLETKSASSQPDGCRFVAELDQLRRAGRARPSNARLPRLRPSGEVLPFAKNRGIDFGDGLSATFLHVFFKAAMFSNSMLNIMIVISPLL